VYDESHVIQVDELEVRDNLTVETWPIRVEDREVKRLRGKEIVLVKVILLGGRVVTARFFVDFIFMCLMCFSMLVCDYLSLGVISWVFVLEGYFGLLMSKGSNFG